MTNAGRRVEQLVEASLGDLSDAERDLSGAIDKATRVARLRGDALDLVWLVRETLPLGDDAARMRAVEELRPQFASTQELRTAWDAATEAWLSERQLDPKDDEGQLLGMSVREMETHLASLVELIEDTRAELITTQSPTDRAQLGEVRTNLMMKTGHVRTVLGRIRDRTHSYLSLVEREIAVSEMVTSIFDDQRRYIEHALAGVAPDALAQLAAADERRGAADPEARSHALTSCRRALKTVADAVYPARTDPVTGADGVERRLTESRYIGRLLQFAYENAQGRASQELLEAQISDLAARLEAINDLASKGVHANATEFEVNQVILQTYLTIGDVLRLGGVGDS